MRSASPSSTPVYAATHRASAMPTTSSAFGVLFFASKRMRLALLTIMNRDNMMTPQAMTEERFETRCKNRSGACNPALASTTSSSVPTITAPGAMTYAAFFRWGFDVFDHELSAPSTNAPAPSPARNK